MKYIQLTQGKFATVDDSDYEYLNQWKWQADKCSNVWYAKRTDCKNNRRKVSMHRVILSLTDPSIHTDHIDGDGLNNQRSNLRECTPAQNNMNKLCQKNNLLGVKGVTWRNRYNKFTSRIRVNGKLLHLGYFTQIEDAVAARKSAETKYHGDFARQTV